MKTYHYVYRITNTLEGKHYYGLRSSSVHPSNDLGVVYFSSSSNKEFIKEQKKNPHNFKYKIVKICSDRKSAAQFEIDLHNKFDVKVNESFYNLSNACSLTRVIHNTAEQQKNYSEKQYKEHCKSIHIANKRYYDSLSVDAKEKHTRHLREWKLNNPEKVKDNLKKATDKRRGANNGSARRINIFNADGKLMFECHGNYRVICEEHGIPSHKIKESYLNNGKPLYTSPYGQTIAKQQGLEKFIGWYAKYNEGNENE